MCSLVPVIPFLPLHDDVSFVVGLIFLGNVGDGSGTLGSSNRPKFFQGGAPGFVFGEGVAGALNHVLPLFPLGLTNINQHMMNALIDFQGHTEGGVDGRGAYENAQLAHQQLTPLVGLDGLFSGL